MIVPSRGCCLGSHLDKDIREGKKSVVCISWRLKRRSGFYGDFSENRSNSSSFLAQDFTAGAAGEGCGAEGGRCCTDTFLIEAAFPAPS